MKIADLRWLENRPSRHASDEETLSYKLQLLVENRFVAASALALKQAAARAAPADRHALRFAVPGAFNGRLFDCRLTVSAGELDRAQWLGDFERQLRVVCRATGSAHEQRPAPSA